eukprot:TRINITY_DN10834_c0_g1_i6.p1 TRINITY_DN10834_c0_g1~~TRINITY_DN10834_c0_g1_i6.p1  ORF type:complete len:121 (-),score=22.01 TRINITY_DN10834_c0_g1_i6:34-396(-)
MMRNSRMQGVVGMMRATPQQFQAYTAHPSTAAANLDEGNLLELPSLSSIKIHVCTQHTPHCTLMLSLIHISEPTRLLSISYAVFCLKKKKTKEEKKEIHTRIKDKQRGKGCEEFYENRKK